MNVKKKFPWGILLLMLFLLLLASCLAPAAYFYYTTRMRTAEITGETRTTYISMAETLASLVEISYASRDISRIKKAFMEKPPAQDMLEKFFVLSNGAIIAHSDSKRSRALHGNIASDEFAYNLDQIFLPLGKKTREVFFLDYNIIDRKIPYQRRIWVPLKKHIYSGIDRVGWLATRAVYSQGKPIGTVNIIISKKRIYRLIDTVARNSLIMTAGMTVFSLFLSFFVSLFIYRRYGKVVTDAAAPYQAALPLEEAPGADLMEIPEIQEPDESEKQFNEIISYQGIKDAIPMAK